MSFSLDDEDNQPTSQMDEENQSGGAATPAGASQTDVSLGGGSDVVSAGGGGNVGNGKTAQAQAAKPSSSGSWTNLQSYLDANAGQGAQVGSQIAGTITDQGQKAQSDVSNAGNEFGNAVNANTVNADADQISGAISRAQQGQSNADDIANVQRQANATYGGPTDFTQQAGYGKAQQDINAANTSLDQTKSEAGRGVLLGNQYKNASANGYNQGERSLDQMLLENNPESQKSFSGLRDQFSGLNATLAGETAKQNAAAQNAIATNQATSAAARGAVSAADQSLHSNLDQNLARLQSQNPATLEGAIQSGAITAREAQSLQQLGLDPMKYISTKKQTLANTATADQYAQARALAALAGKSDSDYLSSSGQAQAGSAVNPYAYDSNASNSDVQRYIAQQQASGDAQRANAKADANWKHLQFMMSHATGPDAADPAWAAEHKDELDAARRSG